MSKRVHASPHTPVAAKTATDGLSASHIGISRDRADNQMTVPPIVNEVLHSPGQPLDLATRAFMEPRFGHDFSKVRVHYDRHAAKSAQVMDAVAYTFGQHIVFGSGQYDPTRVSGLAVLGHELAHVVQQRQGSGGRQLGTNAPHEVEADTAALMIAQGMPGITIREATGNVLARTTQAQQDRIMSLLMQRLGSARQIPGNAAGPGQTNIVTDTVMLLTRPDGTQVGFAWGRHQMAAGGPHAEIVALRNLRTLLSARGINPGEQFELFVLTTANACTQCQQRIMFETPQNWRVRVYHPESPQRGQNVAQAQTQIAAELTTAAGPSTTEERNRRRERIEQLRAAQRREIRGSAPQQSRATLEIERTPPVVRPPGSGPAVPPAIRPSPPPELQPTTAMPPGGTSAISQRLPVPQAIAPQPSLAPSQPQRTIAPPTGWQIARSIGTGIFVGAISSYLWSQTLNLLNRRGLESELGRSRSRMLAQIERDRSFIDSIMPDSPPRVVYANWTVRRVAEHRIDEPNIGPVEQPSLFEVFGTPTYTTNPATAGERQIVELREPTLAGHEETYEFMISVPIQHQ